MAVLSIYFFTGDFCAAYKNHQADRSQVYATHSEIMRLVDDLNQLGHQVRLVSFVSDAKVWEEPTSGLQILALGAESHAATGLLRQAIEDDNADFIVPHFPNLELLRAAEDTDARLFAVLANSYRTNGLRATFKNRRIVRILNDSRFEWVANHCRPATENLAMLGVRRSKLLAWDIPHHNRPHEVPARKFSFSDPPTLLYAGSVTAPKGVFDVIVALGLLRSRGLRIRFRVAGKGARQEMTSIARRAGVADDVELLGPITTEEVSHEMRTADLVVVPSRHEFPEGLPLTLFEAVASRTPIICSDHPMFTRDFIDGKSASTFVGGDPKSLAAAIERTLLDPTYYRRLSEAACATWEGLTHTTDFRTMITRWMNDSDPSPWLDAQTLVHHT